MTIAGVPTTARLVAFPEPARSEDYARASSEIEERLRRLPGLVALYRTGSVSAPGISDLDHVAVVDGQKPVPNDWRKLSARTRGLAMHTPFLADAETFVRHRWLAHLEPLELLRGEPLPVEARPFPEYSEALLAAEAMTVTLLRLAKQMAVGRVKVRPVLCELHGIRHDLILAGLDRRELPRAWALADEVEWVRGTWQEQPDDTRAGAVRALLRDGTSALLEAIDALAARIPRPDSLVPPLRLAAPWSRVTLQARDAGHEPSLRLRGGSLARRIGSGSARAAELRWRLARYELALPPGVLSLLAGGDAAHAEFRVERDALARRYRQFMELRGRGYSPFGYAMTFLEAGV